jgi:hypothetical protein
MLDSQSCDVCGVKLVHIHFTKNNVGYTVPVADGPLIPILQAFLDQHSKPLVDTYAKLPWPSDEKILADLSDLDKSK